jgi:hypothetical protein
MASRVDGDNGRPVERDDSDEEEVTTLPGCCASSSSVEEAGSGRVSTCESERPLRDAPLRSPSTLHGFISQAYTLAAPAAK